MLRRHLPCCLAILCATACLQAQDQPLEEVFAETFSGDFKGFSKEFKMVPMRGSMSYGMSRDKGVRLNGGTIVVRPVNGGGRVVWTLDLDFAPESKKPAAQLARLGFVLANKTVAGVKFSTPASAPNSRGDVSFELEQSNAPGSKPRLLREVLHDRPFTKGVWQFEYNQGLIRVSAPDGALYCAHIEDQDGLMIAVIGVMWAQHEGGLGCKTMRLESTAAPVALAANAQAELRRASALNQKALAFWRGGEHEEALTHMREASALFLQHRGEQSRDFANSLGNLGHILESAGQIEESVATLQRAMALYQSLLGPDHPQLALTAGHLSMNLIKLGRTPEAIATLEDAVRVRKLVGGEADKLAGPYSELLDIFRKQARSSSAATPRPQAQGTGSTAPDPKAKPIR